MVSKIRARHLKSVGLFLLLGGVGSAASYVAAKPIPIYENNQLVVIPGFAGHDNGWPIPYFHYACFPYPAPSCTQYLDWWALAINLACWAVAFALAWFVFRLITRKQPAKKH